MADERAPDDAGAEQAPGGSLERSGAQAPAARPAAPAEGVTPPASGRTTPPGTRRVTITRTVKVRLGLTQVIGILVVGLSVLAMLVGLLAAALMPLGPSAVAAGARGRLYLLLFAPGGIGLLVGILLASRPSRAGTTAGPPDDTGAGGAPS